MRANIYYRLMKVEHTLVYGTLTRVLYIKIIDLVWVVFFFTRQSKIQKSVWKNVYPSLEQNWFV